ncbi:hypothetical protein OJF2_77940 [Aquisphaera giovannonii]|uniref:Uncharacterized protein n=1 Tax=Aquisphaera giovannonii TaxID=406548 RepID=A0A5B9WF22_9BACT|nr:hypothetical protein [Aquisphaera giovannonii]QEH39182.1 hypothetical protein OJF2_77940 [Aquisphaera giovannonii]
MFVRFIVGADDENAAWLTGIIAEARLLRDAGELYDFEEERLEAIYDWFNEHLPCPPFRGKLRSGEWTRDAVAWFKPDAGEPIRRMWDIVAILREHGVAARMITAEKPGKIVYEDTYQVVAETPYWA